MRTSIKRQTAVAAKQRRKNLTAKYLPRFVVEKTTTLRKQRHAPKTTTIHTTNHRQKHNNDLTTITTTTTNSSATQLVFTTLELVKTILQFSHPLDFSVTKTQYSLLERKQHSKRCTLLLCLRLVNQTFCRAWEESFHLTSAISIPYSILHKYGLQAPFLASCRVVFSSFDEGEVENKRLATRATNKNNMRIAPRYLLYPELKFFGCSSLFTSFQHVKKLTIEVRQFSEFSTDQLPFLGCLKLVSGNYFWTSRLAPKVLSNLHTFQTLQQLKISRSLHAWSFVEHSISRLQNLRLLDIDLDNGLDKNAIVHLSKMTWLQTVKISKHSEFWNDSELLHSVDFTPLRAMINLKRLVLGGRIVCAKGLGTLSDACPFLQHLTVHIDSVPTDWRSTTCKFPNLVVLNIKNHSYLGRRGACAIACLPRLAQLTIGPHNDIRLKGLKELARLSCLWMFSLDCEGNDICAEGIKCLSYYRQLSHLVLFSIHVSQPLSSGLEHVRQISHLTIDKFSSAYQKAICQNMNLSSLTLLKGAGSSTFDAPEISRLKTLSCLIADEMSWKNLSVVCTRLNMLRRLEVYRLSQPRQPKLICLPKSLDVVYFRSSPFSVRFRFHFSFSSKLKNYVFVSDDDERINQT